MRKRSGGAAAQNHPPPRPSEREQKDKPLLPPGPQKHTQKNNSHALGQIEVVARRAPAPILALLSLDRDGLSGAHCFAKLARDAALFSCRVAPKHVLAAEAGACKKGWWWCGGGFVGYGEARVGCRGLGPAAGPQGRALSPPRAREQNQDSLMAPFSKG